MRIPPEVMIEILKIKKENYEYKKKRAKERYNKVVRTLKKLRQDDNGLPKGFNVKATIIIYKGWCDVCGSMTNIKKIDLTTDNDIALVGWELWIYAMKLVLIRSLRFVIPKNYRNRMIKDLDELKYRDCIIGLRLYGKIPTYIKKNKYYKFSK